MPDILSVVAARWRLILWLTLFATVAAFVASVLSPKKFLGVATALPANPAVGDRARIFNSNIEGLHTELGSPDELDKIEGTAKLDTIFLAASRSLHLPAHYSIEQSDTLAVAKAAAQLQKNTNISRSGYGELKIKVWDRDSRMAATLANALLHSLNDIHRHLQSQNSRLVLQRLKEDYVAKQLSLHHTPNKLTAAVDTLASTADSLSLPGSSFENMPPSSNELSQQLAAYARLISEYELALKTTPNALLVVEPARPSHVADKPKTGQVVVLAFLASLLFSFLLSVFLESRSQSK